MKSDDYVAKYNRSATCAICTGCRTRILQEPWYSKYCSRCQRDSQPAPGRPPVN